MLEECRRISEELKAEFDFSGIGASLIQAEAVAFNISPYTPNTNVGANAGAFGMSSYTTAGNGGVSVMDALSAQTSDIINAIGAINTILMTALPPSGNLTVTVPVNGVELSRAILSDFRNVSNQTPEFAPGG